jgi:signal transduction histidine kinase/CheY-like chemotaxis protein
LWRLDPATRAIRRFDARDGLPSQEFLPGALAAAPDGVLFAGTLGGAVAFDPATLELATPPPPLRLTALSVRRAGAVVPLDASAPLRLNHDDFDLRVELRALAYADPAANRYQVRLDGFDPDWVDATRGERIWSSLAPGRYRLRARAANADGIWSAYATPLAITVEPPAWATPIAFAGYATASALVLAVAVGGWRVRIRRRHALALAEERRVQSERLSAAKSAFLATMGHEIRTPMTGVLGMSELLLGTSLDERQRDYARSIHQSGELILRIVNDSLDLARIEAGRLRLEDAPFDPAALLRGVATLQGPLAERKQLSLALEIGAGVPGAVQGDALRVKQILLNLVHNALKFTEQGGVTLALSRTDDGALEFRVADTGPGIGPEARARLFARFEQAEGIASRHGGSGLGLSICRELAQLMGGSVDVSDRAGGGSDFRVRLPLAPADLAGMAAPAPTRAVRASLRVLVVEDDRTVADVIVAQLAELGHRGEHAGDALAALGRIAALDETSGFDFALIDLDLPGVDGFELARLLRSQGAPRLPLIAVTARSAGDEEVMARASGMRLLLRKPLTRAALDAAIASVA